MQNPKGSLSKRTIWSAGTEELIPERLRRIINVVMPILYLNFIVFGVLSALYPAPTFTIVVGIHYGTIWAALVALTATQSLFALIFRLKIEIYSSLVLSILLSIYPIFIVYLILQYSPSLDLYRFAVVFAVTLYPIMPIWRVVDIVLDIRRSRQRQLFAEATKGGT